MLKNEVLMKEWRNWIFIRFIALKDQLTLRLCSLFENCFCLWSRWNTIDVLYYFMRFRRSISKRFYGKGPSKSRSLAGIWNNSFTFIDSGVLNAGECSCQGDMWSRQLLTQAIELFALNKCLCLVLRSVQCRSVMLLPLRWILRKRSCQRTIKSKSNIQLDPWRRNCGLSCGAVPPFIIGDPFCWIRGTLDGAVDIVHHSWQLRSIRMKCRFLTFFAYAPH